MGLRNWFIDSEEDFESMGLMVNFSNSKVIASGGIKTNGLSNSKIDSSDVCSLREKANSLLFLQGGK